MLDYINMRLKEARELFGLTVAEAAFEIGKCDISTWLTWEEDDLLAPEYVMEKIDLLIESWETVTKDIQKLKTPKEVCVIYYPTADYSPSILDWRFSQSMCKYLHKEYGTTMILFDPVDYFQFVSINNYQDSQKTRAKWAIFSANKDSGVSH